MLSMIVALIAELSATGVLLRYHLSGKRRSLLLGADETQRSTPFVDAYLRRKSSDITKNEERLSKVVANSVRYLSSLKAFDLLVAKGIRDYRVERQREKVKICV